MKSRETEVQTRELFGVRIPTINEHLTNIYRDGELDEAATIRNFRIVRTEGHVVDVERLKDPEASDDFQELLEKIRDIRASGDPPILGVLTIQSAA